MTESSTIQVREARLPQDLEAIERLWFEYLTWGNEESRHVTACILVAPLCFIVPP
jgi:hypothetical protein